MNKGVIYQEMNGKLPIYSAIMIEITSGGIAAGSPTC
jgi:hypothetical protein